MIRHTKKASLTTLLMTLFLAHVTPLSAQEKSLLYKEYWHAMPKSSFVLGEGTRDCTMEQHYDAICKDNESFAGEKAQEVFAFTRGKLDFIIIELSDTKKTPHQFVTAFTPKYKVALVSEDTGYEIDFIAQDAKAISQEKQKEMLTDFEQNIAIRDVIFYELIQSKYFPALPHKRSYRYDVASTSGMELKEIAIWVRTKDAKRLSSITIVYPNKDIRTNKY